jgi:hypothetical protein
MTNQLPKGDFVKELGNAVRENPISAALIGMGLVWLFTGGKTLDRVGNLAHRAGIDRLPDIAGDAYNSGRETVASGATAVMGGASNFGSRVTENAQKLGQNIGDGGSSAAAAVGEAGTVTLRRVSETTSDFVDSAAQAFRSAPGLGSDMLSNLRGNLSNLFEKQPLFLGAVGVALGAGIAASIPSTDFEADTLGETSDNFKHTASRFASEQKKNVTDIASGAANAALKEAQAQGLTTDGLQGAAKDAGQKIQNVLSAASDSLKGRVTGETRQDKPA